MKRVGWAIAGLVAGAAPLQAQTDVERFERQLEQIQRETRLQADERVPAGQRALVDYGGYVALSFVAIDDPDQETHILRQYDLVGYGRVSFDGAHEFFARGRTTYRDFNEDDAFGNHGDDWVEPTLDRAHYRFDLARARAAYDGQTTKGNLVVQAGRQLVTWANGLTLSEEIDGVVVRLSYDPFDLELLGGLTRPSIADFDSSRPGFLGDTHRGFYGGLLSARTGTHRPFVYALAQRDYNHQDTLLTDPDDPLNPDDDLSDDLTTRFDYNSYYLGVGSAGNLGDNLLYAVEFVYEGGEGLSSSFGDDLNDEVAQTEDDIDAYALDLRLDYLFNDTRRTRLSGELIFASGDDDRRSTSNTFGGNAPDTEDNAFNAFGLLNTGVAFSPNASNLVVARLGASTFPLPRAEPFERFQIGTDLFAFGKSAHTGPIDEETGDDRYLGFESDLYVNWQLSSDVAVTLRYGVFFPGEAIEADHDERHFLFTGFTYAF